MFLKKVIIILCLLSVGAWSHALAVSDSADVNVDVTSEPSCNNNNICESERWETSVSCPADCPAGGGGPVEPFGLYITNVETSNVTVDSAEILWKTNRPALCTFFWGGTPDYEKEIIFEAGFEREHLTRLENLGVSTNYYFKISCHDASDIMAESGPQQFQTLYILKNVVNFRALGADNKIILTWENPDDPNFLGVKLAKSANFFPASVYDGQMIYEGNAVSFVDTNVENGKTYYYTAFSFDAQSNYSSGAVAFVTPKAEGVPPGEKVVPLPALTPECLGEITFDDFNFYSGNKKVALENNAVINVNYGEPLIISLDARKALCGVKTIMVEYSKDGEIFSFLFSQNKEKTIYTVEFFVPEKSGTYPLTISFLDRQNRLIKKISGQLSVFAEPPVSLVCPSCFLQFCGIVNVLLSLLLIVLILILAFLIYRRRKERR